MHGNLAAADPWRQIASGRLHCYNWHDCCSGRHGLASVVEQTLAVEASLSISNTSHRSGWQLWQAASRVAKHPRTTTKRADVPRTTEAQDANPSLSCTAQAQETTAAGQGNFVWSVLTSSSSDFPAKRPYRCLAICSLQETSLLSSSECLSWELKPAPALGATSAAMPLSVYASIAEAHIVDALAT